MAPLAARLRAVGYVVRAPLGPGYGLGAGITRGVDCFERWIEYFGGQFDELVSRYSRVSIGGLCIGSSIAIEIAAKRATVVSLMLISTTLFYDGWNVPRMRALLPLGYYTPLRSWYRVRETDPYGIKNPRLREWVGRQMHRTGASIAGAASLPLTAIYQAQRLIRVAKRSLRTVTVPALVMHARQDDVASLRSADLVCTSIGSREVTRLVFDDSYHMLTLDNERAAVAQAAVDFLERRTAVARDELPVWGDLLPARAVSR